MQFLIVSIHYLFKKPLNLFKIPPIQMTKKMHTHRYIYNTLIEFEKQLEYTF